ncbi:tetratricopeptide repeat protein [Aeromonas taiwanensis]|uniref:tetratricopeptide repeat protein n=1 Tax=Aeromonas taiwanensis TaxID=633417 RepID=UPI003BA3963F
MKRLPTGWDEEAQASWRQERRQEAIQRVLTRLNGERIKSVPLQLQFAYYLFLSGDPATAAQVLTLAHNAAPDDIEVLRNLCVCLSRSDQHERAVTYLAELVRREPADYLAQDGLCTSLAKLGRHEEAAQAGTRALTLKEEANSLPVEGWGLPAEGPDPWLAGQEDRTAIIAFSLWGEQARYLRGALDNVLAAAYLYPGWRVRFYVDASVPEALLACLREHGAEICMQPGGQSLRQRLCWRFQVANDPGVGRFLVRDADSVLNLRERLAVDDWLASGRWFHIMRDWWSHTDLVLAGMWGGVAGVLPPLTPLLEGYQPGTMETPNIDQWFLRDCLWRYLRQSSLVHDRCFAPGGVVPWPRPAPAGNEHVGQDIFRAQGEKQAARLAPWIAKLSCLR